jgi:DNA repair exonuclease SbcCD nuclease subunit
LRNAESKGENVVRVILTADNHLSAYSPKLAQRKLAERRKRLGLAFKQVVDMAIQRSAHLFIHAGDLFDNVDPRNRERDFVAEQLMRLRSAGIHIFAVSGNHDTPRQKTEQGGFAPQSIYHQLDAMHYFSSSDVLEPVQVDVAGIRLALAGLSYHPGVAPGGDPLDHVELIDPDKISTHADLGILILHTAIEGHAFPGEMETLVRRSSLSKWKDFRVVLAGHIHAYERFAVGKMDVVVCGATERMEFGQSEDKSGFVYLELTRNGLHSTEHIPIKSQPRHVVRIRSTELWPLQPGEKDSSPDNVLLHAPSDSPSNNEISRISLTKQITRQLEPYCTEDAMVRLILEGPITREQYHMLDLRGIWLYGQQRAFSFEVDESRLLLRNDLLQEHIERGERIAPRDMLESLFLERLEHADDPALLTLLIKTRQRVLDRYDELAGRETNR